MNDNGGRDNFHSNRDGDDDTRRRRIIATWFQAHRHVNHIDDSVLKLDDGKMLYAIYILIF